jgi:hypothetical protein
LEHDPHTAALRRLLADAREGGSAKVDALLALAQRTVFVVPWPKPEDGWRTLVSSGGESALPIFSDRAELDSAATRFGWLAPDGSAPALEVGSRDTLRYARDRNLSYVVVDIAADHSIEISQAEIEPLLSPAARRESAGPFSGAGRVSSTLMRAVKATPNPMQAVDGRADKRTPPPGSLPAAALGRPTPAPGTLQPVGLDKRTPPPGSVPAVPTALPAPPPGQAPSSPGNVPAVKLPEGPPLAVLASTRIGAAIGTIEDAVLDRLDAVLRDYPEVEFGCIGGLNGKNALGLRIDARMRKRVDTLAAALGKVAPLGLEVVLLDDADHFRAARTESLVFFPWRRR